jgi:hypothetical protein
VGAVGGIVIKSLGRSSKSISVYVTALVAWGTFVTQSAPHQITSAEWMLLAAATGQFAIAWLVPNAEQSDPPPIKPIETDKNASNQSGGTLPTVIGGTINPPMEGIDPAPAVRTAIPDGAPT